MSSREGPIVISEDSDADSDCEINGTGRIRFHLNDRLTRTELKGIERWADMEDVTYGGDSLTSRAYKHRVLQTFLSEDGTQVTREVHAGQPLANDNKRSGLHNLSSELLAKVCERLEPIWIYNLSHTCSRLLHGLAGPDANLIWYKALPPIIWAKGEKYQDEGELREWAKHINAAKPPVAVLKVPINDVMDIDADDEAQLIPETPKSKIVKARKLLRNVGRGARRAIPALIDTDTANSMRTHVDGSASRTSPDTSVPSSTTLQERYGTGLFQEIDGTRFHSPPLSASFPSISLDAFYVARMRSPTAEGGRASRARMENRHMPPIKRQRTSKIQGADGHLFVPTVPDLVVRKQVKALGGPYQAIFSYKREIIRRWETRQRCFICLCLRSFLDKSPVENGQWGVRWCKDCLCENSISLSSLERLVGDLKKYVDLSFPYPYSDHERKCLRACQLRLYKVETDKFFAATGLVSTRFASAMRERVMIAKMQTPDRRLKTQTLDLRKQLRLETVRAAESIWEGVDPSPDKVLSGSTVISIPRPKICRQRFERFRNRFAPTSKLREFLFPAHLLPDGVLPKLAPGQKPESGYLADPYQKVILKSPRPTARAVADTAERMLELLTNYHVGQRLYESAGRGGFCTAWTKAAEAWHVERITSRQLTGDAINAFRPFLTNHKKTKVSLFDKLRFGELAPLVDERTLTKPLTPKGLYDSNGIGACVNYLIADEAHIKETESQRQLKVAAFHRISMETCKRCPHNGLLLPAKGINALFQHMRHGHSTQYWECDDWDIVG